MESARAAWLLLRPIRAKLCPFSWQSWGVKSSARRMRFCARHAQGVHRAQQAFGGRILRREGFILQRLGGWNGLLACRQDHCSKATQQREPANRLGRVAYAGKKLFRGSSRWIEVDVLWRRRVVPGNATRHRNGVAAILPFSRLANRILAYASGGWKFERGKVNGTTRAHD